MLTGRKDETMVVKSWCNASIEIEIRRVHKIQMKRY